MEQEDVIALEEFAVSNGGLKRNGEMCFDAQSLDELLRATRSLLVTNDSQPTLPVGMASAE